MGVWARGRAYELRHRQAATLPAVCMRIRPVRGAPIGEVSPEIRDRKRRRGSPIKEARQNGQSGLGDCRMINVEDRAMVGI